MTFIALHRALGLNPTPLTFEHIRMAVQQSVTEEADLDWKAGFPDARNPNGGDELAKDITAMANSGGGTIVYGVKEDSVTSAAAEIVGVAVWSDGEERRLRSLTYNLIQPVVHGLQFTPLSDDGTTIVVLTVPASLEAPHFQFRGAMFRAPRRYGAQTVDMSELEIEQAYSARLEGRGVREKSLEEMEGQVHQGIPTQGRVRLTLTAVPLHPRPSMLGRLDKDTATDLVDDLRIWNPYLAEKLGGDLAFLNPNVRRGLRKWRTAVTDPSEHVAAVDLHDDGAVAWTWARKADERLVPGTDVHIMDAHLFAAYAAWFVHAAANQIGLSGGYQTRLTMRGDGEGPLYIRTVVNNSYVDPVNLTPIHTFYPVTSLLDGTLPEEGRLAQAHALALDVLNQAGLDSVDPKFIRSIERGGRN